MSRELGAIQTINTLRVLGSLIGGAFVGQLLTVRSRFHTEMLLDHAAFVGNSIPQPPDPSALIGIIAQQSMVLSVADAYRVLGSLSLLLIPLALRMAYVPAPDVKKP